MARSNKHKNSEDSKQYDETPLENLGYSLDEDEYGYLKPKASKRVSTALISQLPSRHLDDLLVEEAKEESRTTLRRKDSHYRTLQLKNATLNTHNFSIGAEKIYEILSSDQDADEEVKLKTLREMHQSLTIKRQVKERLDKDKEKKIATQSIGVCTRFKLGLFMAWDKFQYELRSISYLFEPWHSSIKTIQGQFGSGVASYFIFLRWLLYINVWNFFITFCFVVIPQLTFESVDTTSSHKNSTWVSFDISDLLTGSGWFTDSLFYFGYYTHHVFEAIPDVPYNMPLAYLLTIGVNSLINLIAVSSSITASYQKNYVDTAGEIKHVFCNKIFSAWDYGIETDNAAHLQKQAFCNEMKEILYMKREGQHRRTAVEHLVQRTLLILVSLFSLAAIAGVGFITYYLLEKKSLRVNIRILEDMTLSLTVTLISSASYFLLKFSSKLELYLSKRIKLYLTMFRVVTLRIVMLGIIVYFWIVIYKPPRNQQICYETELGKEIYRLILVNFLVTLLIFTLIGEFLRKFITRYFSFIQSSTFDVAYNTLDLIYYQTLAWIAFCCVPLGSLMIIVILIVLFYVKKSSMSLNCLPPKRSWSLNEAQTCYLILTFIMFFFAAVIVAYYIFGSEPSACGPFQEYDNTVDVIRLLLLRQETVFADIVKYITSPSILFAIFCALGLAVYYMRAQAKAHISVIKKIREQLILASKDKVFLLRLFDEAFTAYMQNKASSNNNKNEIAKAPQRPQPRRIISNDGNQPEVTSIEAHTIRPTQSPIHKRSVPSHLAANKPVTYKAHGDTLSGFDSSNTSPPEGQRFRSPILSVGRDSPQLIRRGSPYPSHQHGFRHVVPGDNPPQSPE